MGIDNTVVFKGSSKGLVIQLDQDVDYDIIKECFLKKIENSANFFDKRSISIIFKGKELTDSQQKELLKIISEKTTIKFAFIKPSDFDEFEQKSPEPKIDASKASIDELIQTQLHPHNVTKFFKGNIRSGRLIEFDGSVIVIGDVNPGAEVRAGGNIIILGALKGLAHAGYNGMRDAFVAALSMTPVQLRIADIITRFPEEEINRTDKSAEYASIEDGQIYVVPLI